MPDQNGTELPTITIAWNQEVQAVGLKFDTKEFKTWDFIIAVLDMARQSAEMQKRVGQMQNLQQAGQQVMQAEAIKRSLKLG